MKTKTFHCLKRQLGPQGKKIKQTNKNKQAKKLHHAMIFQTFFCICSPTARRQTPNTGSASGTRLQQPLVNHESFFHCRSGPNCLAPSSPMGEKTCPEHKLTLPAVAPASPHGIHSGSPGMSGCLLSPQTPPAAGLGPAPPSYLRG